MSVNVGVLDALLSLKDDFTPTLNKAVANLQTKAGQADAAGKKISAVGGSFDTLKGAINSMRGVLAGAGIALFVNELISAQTQLDRLNNGMLAATGSSSAAAKELAFVTETADRLGLSLQGVAQSYTIFTAAAKGTAIEGQAARDIFTATAEAATALGLSAEQTSGALTAFQQMVSKGTVQAEELRGQLAERIPGAFNMAARAMGMTTMQLGEMLVEGKVLAKDLLPKLAAEMHKTFGPGVAAGAQSLQAEINRLSTKMFEFYTTVSKGLDLAGVIREVSLLSDEVGKLGSGSGGAAESIKAVGQAVKDLVVVLRESLGLLGEFISAWNTIRNFKVQEVSLADLDPGRQFLTKLREAVDVFRELDTDAAQLAKYPEQAAAAQGVYNAALAATGNEIAAWAAKMDFFDEAIKRAGKSAGELDAELRAAWASQSHAHPNADATTRAKQFNDANVRAFQRSLAKLTKEWVDGAPAAKEYESALESFQTRVKKAADQEKFAKLTADMMTKARLTGVKAVKAAEREIAVLTKMQDFAIDPVLAHTKGLKDQVAELKKLTEEAYDAALAQEELEEKEKKSAEATEEMSKAITAAFNEMDAARKTQEENVKKSLDDLKFEVEWQGRYEAALRSGSEALRQYAIAQDMAQFQRDNPGATPGDLAIALAQFTALEDRIATSTALTEWEREARGVVEVFDDIDGKLGSIADYGVDIALSFKKMGDAAATSGERFAALAGIVTGVVGILRDSGLIAGPGGGTSQFGGEMSGTYSAEGAMVGAIIGAIVGTVAYGQTAAGAAIGSAIGEVVGSMINKGADEGLVRIRDASYSASSKFSIGIAGVNNKLARNLEDAATQMIENLEDIVSSLGAELAGIADIDFKVRDDEIIVFVNGIRKAFKEMDEAMSFAMSELLRTAETLNMDELFKSVLQNSSAQSLEALQGDLESIAEIISFGFTDSQNNIKAFKAELSALSNVLIRNVTDTEQLARGLANLGAEEARLWQSSRDAITGEQRTNAEKLAMLRQDAEMWNAEKAIRIADLQLEALEIEQKLALFKANAELVKEGGKLYNAKYEMDRARLIAERDLMSGQRDIYQADIDARSAYIDAQAALLQVQLDAINKLVGVLVSMPDIDVPNLQLPNIGGGGGGGGIADLGPSETEQRAAAFLEFLESYRLSGLSDTMRALDELNRAFAEQALAASEVEGGELQLAAARRQALADLREDVIDAFGSPMEELRDRIAEIRQQVEDWFAVNTELGEQFQRGEISLQQLLDALAEANVLWAEFGDMARQELLGLASYFADAMGNTEESARIREELAEMEWDFNRLQMQMLVETWAELGILSQAAADHWRDFIATLPENRPGNVNDSANGSGGSLQSAIARLRNAIDALRRSNEDLLLSDVSPLSTADQFAEAERIYNETLAAAQGGDLQAIEDFASVRDQYLQLAAAMYGTAGAGYESIFQQSLQAGQDLAAAGQAILDAIPPQMQGVEDRLDTIAEILAAIAAAQAVVVTPPPGGAGGGGGPLDPPRPPHWPGEGDPVPGGGPMGHPPRPPVPGGYDDSAFFGAPAPVGGSGAQSSYGLGGMSVGGGDAVGQLRELNSNMLLLMQAVESQARESRNLALTRTPATVSGGRRR